MKANRNAFILYWEQYLTRDKNPLEVKVTKGIILIILIVVCNFFVITVQHKDPPNLEDMDKDRLKLEIKKELEEIGKREEVFVIIIDAVNQVKMTLPILTFTSILPLAELLNYHTCLVYSARVRATRLRRRVIIDRKFPVIFITTDLQSCCGLDHYIPVHFCFKRTVFVIVLAKTMKTSIAFIRKKVRYLKRFPKKRTIVIMWALSTTCQECCSVSLFLSTLYAFCRKSCCWNVVCRASMGPAQPSPAQPKPGVWTVWASGEEMSDIPGLWKVFLFSTVLFLYS